MSKKKYTVTLVLHNGSSTKEYVKAKNKNKAYGKAVKKYGLWYNVAYGHTKKEWV